MRTDGPDDFVHGAGQFTGRQINLSQARHDLLRILPLSPIRLAEQHDARQAGAEIVVNVLGDARPFVFHDALPFQTLHFFVQPAAGDVKRRAPHRANARQHGPGGKPPRLPEPGLHGERKRRALLAPNVVVVAGGDPEYIIPRLQITVVSHAPGIDILPIRLQTVEPALESHLFRCDKAEAGVTKFEAMFSRLDSQPGRAAQPGMGTGWSSTVTSSIKTGGGKGLIFTPVGSTTASPLMVGNQSRPSGVRQPAG